jgi:cupin 2 domain-containing protein
VPSIFDRLPSAPAEEVFDTLLKASGVRVERILSHRHSSPEGFWYEQAHGEWVLLLRGRATLRLEHPDERVTLAPGDYLWLAPGRRHRVDATGPDTIWLAVHLPPPLAQPALP